MKAAALLHSIVAGHPLVDGNKRLGWVAVRLFYLLNDADIGPAVDDGFDLVVRLAAGELDDIAEIATVLASWRSQAAT